MWPSRSRNSWIGIWPSDLYPMSTVTNPFATWTTLPLTTSPGLTDLRLCSNSRPKSSSSDDGSSFAIIMQIVPPRGLRALVPCAQSEAYSSTVGYSSGIALSYGVHHAGQHRLGREPRAVDDDRVRGLHERGHRAP